MTILGQMLMEDGIQRGIQQGLTQGIRTGETLFAALTKKLLHDGRIKDLESAAADPETRQKFYQEYGLTDH